MNDAPPNDQEQSFLSHLIELRQRLVRAAVAVLVVFLAMTPFMRDIFDYLSQRVGKRLVEFFCSIAKPGGIVIVTNVADTNPRKAWMEYLMEWNLIYRGKEEMLDLVPAGLPVKRVEVKADTTGVNLFLEIELANG